MFSFLFSGKSRLCPCFHDPEIHQVVYRSAFHAKKDEIIVVPEEEVTVVEIKLNVSAEKAFSFTDGTNEPVPIKMNAEVGSKVVAVIFVSTQKDLTSASAMVIES